MAKWLRLFIAHRMQGEGIQLIAKDMQRELAIRVHSSLEVATRADRVEKKHTLIGHSIGYKSAGKHDAAPQDFS